MAFKITTFTGEVKGLNTGGPGRAPSELTLALQNAIMESALDGKARKWDGAADDYRKNAQKVRVIGNKLKTEAAPHGYSVNVGLSGKDLTFIAKPAVTKEQRAAAEAAEIAAQLKAEAEAAKPKPSAPKKATKRVAA